MESHMADAHDLDELDQSRAETRAAFENRALLYAYVYEELSDELGEERATELMERAIHRRGIEVGRKYRPAAAARDLEEVGRIFCDGSPCEGALFEPVRLPARRCLARRRPAPRGDRSSLLDRRCRRRRHVRECRPRAHVP
jgi:hypothetical protein